MDTETTLFKTLLNSLIFPFLVAVIVPFFVSLYFNTYINFRKDLLDVRKHLQLYSNLYMNYWDIDSGIFPEVSAAQKSLRVIWATVDNSYLLIPKWFRRVLELVRWLPDHKKFKDMLGNLLFLHNSTIIYRSESEIKEKGHNELMERKKAIDEVNKFMDLYIK